MDFLKRILGEELFNQMVEKINAHNSDETNKDNQIKIGNLGNGDYVEKNRYDNLQAKVTDAEKLLAESKAREMELKVKYAFDVAMLAEGVKKENAELLAIALERKLKEQGETLELDDNGNIKGWNDKVSALKTQFPTMFESEKGGKKIFDEDHLPDDISDRKTEPKNLAEALREEFEHSAE